MRSTWTKTLKHRIGLAGSAPTLALGLALAGSLAGLAGCLVTNQNHCGLNQGACSNGLMCSVCAVDNNGCVTPDEIVDAACMFGGETTSGPTSATEPLTGSTSPTTTESTVDPSGTTTAVNPTTTGDPTTDNTATTVDPTLTGSESTVGPDCMGDMVGNPQCGGDLPYCIDEKCVSCMGQNCGLIEPGKPACEETSGLCVECLQHSDCLNDDKPACDEDTATCRTCSDHDECPATACDLETGMCLPESCVFYVDLTKSGEFPCDDAGAGTTQQTPLCTLQKAATLLQADKPCTIKLKAGTQPQSAPTVIPAGNITVAIIHYGDTLPSLQVPNDPAITIQAGNRVYMRRIAITNSPPTANPAIECTGAVLWLDNQRISNTRTALHALDCKIHVRQSIIFGHTFGGLDIQGTDVSKAQLWLENSYITSMTSSIFGAVRLIGAAKADVLYSTIALVKSVVPPFECIGGFSGTINVRNSAVIGPDPRFGAGCKDKVTVTTSYESTESMQPELVGTFSTFNGGQLQAKIDGPLTDVAVWKTGDPKVDQDGSPRPQVDGVADYAGADQPVR